MAMIVVTRMQAKNLRTVKAAMSLTNTVVDGLVDQPGFRGGRLRLDRRKAMWTITVWEDAAALAAFRTAHEPVAARSPELDAELVLTAWQQDGDALPTWRQVRARWTDVVPPAGGVSKPIRPARTTASV
jgi:heme-degrading monooxygenase HmoA